MADGLASSKMRQLYITVALPALTYTSDIWYTPPFRTAYTQKLYSSVKVTKLLRMIQGMATRYITGGIKGIAYDMLEIHTYVPPVDLLFHKAQFRAASRICALPPDHPLRPLACRTAADFVKSHWSPLHYLFFTTSIKPKQTKTISPVHHNPTYHPTMKTVISKDKETAYHTAMIAHNMAHYKVYCDGLGYKNRAGTAAVLYKGNRVVKSLLLHVGPTTEHTVYETKLIGILLALHLLTLLSCQLMSLTVIIGLDNQVAIKSLNNQNVKPAHYLLDQIHNAAKHLQSKQDHIICKADFQQAKCNNLHLKTKTRDVCDLHINWVSGHSNFEPNEKADEANKRAALGESSLPKDLPSFLHKPILLNIATLHQESNARIQRIWA